MRRRGFGIEITAVALMFLGYAVGFSAQQSPVTTIEGVVVNAEGEPIRSARVTLSSANSTPLATNAALTAVEYGDSILQIGDTQVRIGADKVTIAPASNSSNAANASQPARPSSLTTDDEGKFSFRGVDPGEYRISASADGYLTQEYLQLTPNTKGKPIFVSVGETVRNAVIKLTRTSTVSGRVLDDLELPAVGASVQLLRPSYSSGGKYYRMIGSAKADDRGQYRIFGLAPGRYYLVAGTPPGPESSAKPVDGALPASYELTYFPSGKSMDEAVPIDLTSGNELPINMKVKRESRTYRIRGSVLDSSTGRPPRDVVISLAYHNPGGAIGWVPQTANYDSATGSFELRNMISGDYMLVVLTKMSFSPVGGPRAASIEEGRAIQMSNPFATFPLRVTGDRDDIAVVLGPDTPTLGRVTVEGATLSPPDNINSVRLALNVVDQRLLQYSPAVMPTAPDGAFQIIGLRNLEYRATVSGVPAGFYVKSVRFLGEDILGRPFSGGAGMFDITLRRGLAQISGVITDELGRPAANMQVAIIPSRRERTDLYRTTTSDRVGQFKITGVTPNEYRVFSWEALEEGAFFDPDFMARYDSQGQAISVAEGSSLSVNARLIPAPR